MNPREYMIRRREALGLTVDQMAKKCEISPGLLRMLEDDDQCVTGQKIVERIAKQYTNLTRDQKIGMIPPNYRPGPDYDPDRYRYGDSENMFRDFMVVPRANWRAE